ncbi:MAG TPA: G1 family glutamic endopeptidase [Ktedonobacteraceae bacterium]|jgi:hypothetical protein
MPDVCKRYWKLLLPGLILLIAGSALACAALARPGLPAAPQPVGQDFHPTLTALPACFQLPQKLDWQHLSRSNLAHYGLPVPPTSLADLGQWVLLVKNLKHRSCTISLQALSRIHPVQQREENQLAQNCPPGQNCQNPTWAGGIADQHSFAHVQATWRLPCVRGDVKSSSTSAWVGLGGVESHATLVQAGVDTDVDARGAVTYDAWAEVYTPASATTLFHDSQAHLLFSQGLHCGDVMYVQVTSESHGSVDAAYPDTFFLGNLTTGEYQYYTPSWQSSDGSTAEWIVEQPTFVSGQTQRLKPLSNFGTLTFAFCLAYVAEQGFLSVDALPLQLVRIQGRNLPLATPARTAPAAITVQWQRAE